MKQSIFEVVSNEPYSESVWKMTLSGDVSAIARPGQFVDIKLGDFQLRRPVSVHDCRDGGFTVMYKVIGDGTAYMKGLAAGDELDILSGLGNGYDTEPSGDKPLLLGGGIGAAPLYWLCRKLLEEGKTPTVVLGFNVLGEIILEDEFKALNVPVIVATVDGSYGVKGFVTDAMKGLEYSYFYACGPMPMLRAIEQTAEGGGQYSLEARMGCGFGACNACTLQTKRGVKQVCKDGPVFDREEIIW